MLYMLLCTFINSGIGLSSALRSGCWHDENDEEGVLLQTEMEKWPPRVSIQKWRPKP